MGSLVSCLGISRSRSTSVPDNRPAYLRANSQLPFILDKVPQEIILAILHSVCDSASPQAHLRCVRTLSSVCATWRRWVLEDSSFWTQIYVSGYPALDNLRGALTNSRERLIEIGVDLTPLPYAIVTENDTHRASAILRIINAHLARASTVTLAIDARLFHALHRLRSPARSLERLTISIRNADPNHPVSPGIPRFLSEAMPKLARLSVYGLPHPVFQAALVPSLRIVEFHPRTLSYDAFAGLFRACPLLEEVYIRDLCIHARAGEAIPPTPIVASHLKSLSIEGVHANAPWETDVVTSAALSLLPLHTIRNMSLNAVAAQSLLAEARACFRTLGALDTLEFLREKIEDEWHSVGIKATTPDGTERHAHVFIPDVEVLDFVCLTHGTGSQRSLSRLTIPVDWAPTFLAHTDLALGALQSLTLTYNLPHFFPPPHPAPAPTNPPAACALLEEVALDVSHAGVVHELVPLFWRVLSSIIAFDAAGAPHPATLVLSRAFSRAPGNAGYRHVDLVNLRAHFQATRTL